MLKKLVLIPATAAATVLVHGSMALRRLAHLHVENPSGWHTLRGIGSEDADALTRALITRIGIFANSPDETVYLNALPRSGGPGRLGPHPLHGGRHYRVTGPRAMPAAWWSLTLYDAEDFLFANPEGRHSFTDFNLEPDGTGQFTLDIAPTRPAGATNWLPSPTRGAFSLVLRIYEPGPELFEHLETYPLPVFAEVPS